LSTLPYWDYPLGVLTPFASSDPFSPSEQARSAVSYFRPPAFQNDAALFFLFPPGSLSSSAALFFFSSVFRFVEVDDLTAHAFFPSP